MESEGAYIRSQQQVSPLSRETLLEITTSSSGQTQLTMKTAFLVWTKNGSSSVACSTVLMDTIVRLYNAYSILG